MGSMCVIGTYLFGDSECRARLREPYDEAHDKRAVQDRRVRAVHLIRGAVRQVKGTVLLRQPPVYLSISKREGAQSAFRGSKVEMLESGVYFVGGSACKMLSGFYVRTGRVQGVAPSPSRTGHFHGADIRSH